MSWHEHHDQATSDQKWSTIHSVLGYTWSDSDKCMYVVAVSILFQWSLHYHRLHHSLLVPSLLISACSCWCLDCFTFSCHIHWCSRVLVSQYASSHRCLCLLMTFNAGFHDVPLVKPDLLTHLSSSHRLGHQILKRFVGQIHENPVCSALRGLSNRNV